jgi:hypothetical protein
VQDALELEDQVSVENQGEKKKGEADDGEGADAAADGAEVFDELLLFEGIAVCGFSDVLELVFDALKGGDVLGKLGAQLAIAGADLGEAALDGLKVNLHGGGSWRRGRRGMMDVLDGGLRGDEGRDGGGCRGDVAFKQREQALHEWKSLADGVDDALEAGRDGGVCQRGCRRRRGCGWIRRGLRSAAG